MSHNRSHVGIGSCVLTMQSPLRFARKGHRIDLLDKRGLIKA